MPIIPELSSPELVMQRVQTQAFIQANPTVLELIPRIRVRQGNGAWKWVTQAVRPSQVFRVIPQAGVQLLRVEDGTQRRITHQLLGMWDALIAKGDMFSIDGETFRVADLEFYNGYEARGLVIHDVAAPTTTG